jgi:hypothetical protein
MTGPCPVRQQTLQSTCQHVPPLAEAGGDASSAAAPVATTAANTSTAAHFTFFVIIDLPDVKVIVPPDG